ncbi:MAG: hypothetical protein D6770_11155 [Anaerolineae bacterium]|nr:MAG: hypothetical protein D6770_11155 [Anaerolineae bacterium]
MTTYRSRTSGGNLAILDRLFKNRRLHRGAAWGLIILGALLAFEVFNYSTTEFALHDLLGDLRFAGIRWATILAIAFCGIDFAGIARLFTPEQGADEPAEVWYLFGAWLLAAAMNAALTWWGVSVAILDHQSAGSVVVGNETVTRVVPIFVAVMVWLIRVLIIGTFSIAGERLFSQDEQQRRVRSTARPSLATSAPRARTAASRPSPLFTPAPRAGAHAESGRRPQEPTYHNLPMSARSPVHSVGQRVSRNDPAR